MTAIFKSDGRGNLIGYPPGTVVNCNQIGHNYEAHPISVHCLVTAAAPWCDICSGYICRRYLHRRPR